ncbi:MAG: cyclic pyranopterin monophosphate synthase MoaC [Planctomycetes bacterium]|nr:cyclic pyranopterin monophosphate synthase MoaC [Planctomycetota bacterium]
MVDVSSKRPSHRKAVACAVVRMRPATQKLIREGRVPKGDVLAVARLAGIQAAKRTWDLVPLCHQVRLGVVAVEIEFAGRDGVRITATARAEDRTGVEMEALTAAAVAGLTIYDMCKAVDRGMILEEVRLLVKTGGKSDFRATPAVGEGRGAQGREARGEGRGARKRRTP